MQLLETAHTIGDNGAHEPHDVDCPETAMSRRCPLLMIAVLVCCSGWAPLHGATPNIIVILADDFGVGDIQAHYPENRIPTPHLDRLVREGMSFTDAHSSSSVCSPTRYGLLTGRYNWRTRLQEWVIAAYEPPLIAQNRPTLPGFLRQRGYHTACIGKWHLGWEWPGAQTSRMTEQRNGQAFLEWDFQEAVRGGPIERGFDYYFGVDLPNLPPFTFIENDRVQPAPTEVFRPDPAEGIVLPIRFAGAPAAPDWKLQEILPEITRRAASLVRQRAQQESPFFLYFALTSPHEPVVPTERFRGRSGIAPIADFVMETDWAVGEMLRAIDETGIAGETLVIFTADNGHSHYTGWQDLVAAGHHPSGPYRGHKGDIWEGGHRVPLVVRWPGRVTADSTSDHLVCLTDVFATCAEIVEAGLPPDGAEDSLSFFAALTGQEQPAGSVRTSVIHHSNFGEFAYREGPWKLVLRMSGPTLERSRGKPTVAELYNLDSDIAEKNDLTDRHPEIVSRMMERLSELVERGASRTGTRGVNDGLVQFDRTQIERWAPENPGR
jgi:arylsulfatase A